MVAGIRNYHIGNLKKKQKKKHVGLITIGTLLQLQLSVILQPCIVHVLLLTFVTCKSHYSYGNTSTNVWPFALIAWTMQQQIH